MACRPIFHPILRGTVAALLLVGLPGSLHAITDLDLLPWGAAAGDIFTMTTVDNGETQTTAGGVDDAYALVSLKNLGPAGTALPIAFYGSSYNQLYVDSNGLLSFAGGVSSWVGQHFPITPTAGPLIAGYWGDVDTRSAALGGKPVVGSKSGLLWYRTATDTPTLTHVAEMISEGFAGVIISGGQPQNGQTVFTPTVVQIATWDHVGVYSNNVANSSTFQIVVASDGIQSYTMFLYPQQEQNWLQGSVANSPPPQAGFDAGDGVNYFDAIGSQTAAMSQAWSKTNTLPPKPGMQIYRIDSGTGGTLNLDIPFGTQYPIGDTRLYTLNLANSGNIFTPGSPTGSVLQFDTLTLPAGGSVNFTGNLTVVTGPNANSGITQGHLNFTDTSIFALRGTNTVNGGALHLSKSAQVQLYNSGVTTAAAALTFDNASGGTGGTLDLRGFNTTLGSINSLTAGSGIITNSGAGPSTLTLGSDVAASTFSGQILNGTGGISLIKNGSTTLTLAGANTHSGTTTLNAGTTILAHQNALQNSTAVLNGGALIFDSSVSGKAFTLGGLAGPGNLALENNNAGSPQPIALTVGGNGGSTTFSGNLTGGGSLTKTGAGTLTLSGTNSYNGITNVTGGGLQFSRAASLYNSSSSAALSAAVTATNFTVQTGASASFNVGGTGEFTPAQITTLAALGSFKNNSTLGVDTSNASGAVTFTAPLLTSAGNTTPITLAKLGTGTMTLGADNVLHSLWSLSATTGTLDIGSFNQTVANLQLAGGNLTGTTGTLTSNSAYDLRSGMISAQLAGSVALNKTTTGTVKLSRANTYTGVTTVSAGTLQFVNPAALYNSTTGALSGSVTAANLVVQSGATAAFNLGGSGEFTQPEIATLASLSGFQSGSWLGLDTSNAGGAVVLTTPLVSPNSGATAIGLSLLGSGTLKLGANNVIGSSFTVAVSGGTLDLGAFNDTVAGVQLTGGTILGVSGFLLSTTAFDLRAGTVIANLTGSVALNKNTAGTVTLFTPNSYSGSTNLNAGVLNIASPGALGSGGTIFFAGGTLQYSTGSTQDYSSRFSTSGNQQFRIDTNGQNGTLAGTVSGANSSFTKLGAGTLTITGALNHTGPTNVLGGTLAVSGSINGTNNLFVGDGVNPAILTGTGTITPGESGVVLIKNGATLAPGGSGTNKLTLAALSGAAANNSTTANAALEFEDTATFQLSIANSNAATHGVPATADYTKFSLSTNTSATLDGLLDILLTGSVNDGDVFPILTSSTAGTILGTFTNAPDRTTFSSHGRYWEINYQWNSATAQSGVSEATFQTIRGGSNIAIFAIPEPSSLATLLVGTALLATRRPRRRSTPPRIPAL